MSRPAASSGAASAPTVLVLASGRGERFRASGGLVHKLDALLAGVSVLDHVLHTVRATGLPWHLERASHAGMGDSLAAAVRATPAAAGWLILPADLPLIRSGSIVRVAAALRSLPTTMESAVVPWVDGVQAHPVGFSVACSAALLALGGDTGARSVLRRLQAASQVRPVKLLDVGAVLDVDTLDDLERAHALLLSRATRDASQSSRITAHAMRAPEPPAG